VYLHLINKTSDMSEISKKEEIPLVEQSLCFLMFNVDCRNDIVVYTSI
jgi:hypothetical protein